VYGRDIPFEDLAVIKADDVFCG